MSCILYDGPGCLSQNPYSTLHSALGTLALPWQADLIRKIMIQPNGTRL